MMAFYTFTNNTLADADEVNANFDAVIYSILYNRMEKDQAAYTQIDPTIQSDQFSDADGRYNTVCVAGTTSTFSTNLYHNCAITTANPFSYHIVSGYCCTVSGSACISFTNTFSAGCYNFGVAISKPNCAVVCASVGTSCTEYCQCMCATNISFCNYCDISIVHCQQAFVSAASNTCGSACAYSNFNGFCNTFNITSGNCNWVKCICLTKVSGNTYNYCVDGASVCCLDITSFSLLSNGAYKGVATISFALCAPQTIISCAVYNYVVNTKTVTNTTINSNLKNYATPRNAAMLVTNSVLPAGNTITYDIKNQAGCTYLCNASPNQAYNLCADDSCCFYAVIKQNISCNLCTPQCMFGYALKLM